MKLSPKIRKAELKGNGWVTVSIRVEQRDAIRLLGGILGYLPAELIRLALQDFLDHAEIESDPNTTAFVTKLTERKEPS
jgi:hypothetical protein